MACVSIYGTVHYAAGDQHRITGASVTVWATGDYFNRSAGVMWFWNTRDPRWYRELLPAGVSPEWQ